MNYWLKRYLVLGTVASKKPARPDYYSTRLPRQLHARRSVPSGAPQQRKLDRSPHVVSMQTINRALRLHASLGGPQLVPWRGCPRQQLTSLDRKRCLAFALTNKHTNWSTVHSTDREMIPGDESEGFPIPSRTFGPRQWQRQRLSAASPSPSNNRLCWIFSRLCPKACWPTW